MSDGAIRRFFVGGRVQGVGYRAWCVREAQALGLSGWVRNRADGSVEVVAAGRRMSVSELMERCRRGPPGASVEHVTSDPEGAAADEIPEPGRFFQAPTV